MDFSTRASVFYCKADFENVLGNARILKLSRLRSKYLHFTSFIVCCIYVRTYVYVCVYVRPRVCVWFPNFIALLQHGLFSTHFPIFKLLTDFEYAHRFSNLSVYHPWILQFIALGTSSLSPLPKNGRVRFTAAGSKCRFFLTSLLILLHMLFKLTFN